MRHYVDREGDRLAIFHPLHFPNRIRHQRQRRRMLVPGRRICQSHRDTGLPPGHRHHLLRRGVFLHQQSRGRHPIQRPQRLHRRLSRRKALHEHYRPRRHLCLCSVLRLDPHERSAYWLAAGRQQVKVLAFGQLLAACADPCVAIQRRLHYFRALGISRHSRRGLETIGQKFARHVCRRHFLIVSRAASSLHGVAGQKLFMAPHPLRFHCPAVRILRSGNRRSHQQRRTPKGPLQSFRTHRFPQGQKS
jgi:hypothetical protein